jgi:hypothetical protein
MKRNLLMAALLFSSVFCFSQENNLKHEIGINFFALDAFGSPTEIVPVIFPGVTYKYHLTNANIRFGAEYRNYEYDFLDLYTNPYGKTGKLEKISLWTGIERPLFKGRFKLFPVADITYIHSVDEYTGHADWPPYDYSDKNISSVIALKAGIGINYRITKNLSFSIESNISLGFDFSGENEPAIGVDDTYGEVNPIRVLSLNCHF